jgi:choline dehydrogenase-like flavoprotein
MAERLKPVDAVTIGVGLTGSLAALQMAQAGLKVSVRRNELEPQHDSGHHAETERDAEDLEPELENAAIGRPARRQIAPRGS